MREKAGRDYTNYASDIELNKSVRFHTWHWTFPPFMGWEWGGSMCWWSFYTFMGQTHLTRTWGTHTSTLEDCKFSLQYKASFMWKGPPKNTDLGFNERGLLNSKTRPKLQNAVYLWFGLLSYPHSLAHMSILPFYISISPLSGLNCSAPATFQVSKQRVALTHVPLTCLSLQSFLSRPPSVSRPSEGNSRFTSLSSVPDIRKSVQH